MSNKIILPTNKMYFLCPFLIAEAESAPVYYKIHLRKLYPCQHVR